jgi:hypothetical protein
VIGPDGKPVTKPASDLLAFMVVTPGPSRYNSSDNKGGDPAGDNDRVASVDPINYNSDLVPDGEGRITLPALMPGAMYRLLDFGTVVRGQAGPEVRKEFTAKPGETVDLGDIRLAKAPG